MQESAKAPCAPVAPLPASALSRLAISAASSVWSYALSVPIPAGTPPATSRRATPGPSTGCSSAPASPTGLMEAPRPHSIAFSTISVSCTPAPSRPCDSPSHPRAPLDQPATCPSPDPFLACNLNTRIPPSSTPHPAAQNCPPLPRAPPQTRRPHAVATSPSPPAAMHRSPYSSYLWEFVQVLVLTSPRRRYTVPVWCRFRHSVSPEVASKCPFTST